MAVPEFLPELRELMPHTLVAQPGFNDEYGAFVASGASITIQCQIEGESRLVRDVTGREVVSSFQALCGEFNNLTVDKHRYTIPSGFGPPREDIIAIAVDPHSDEEGQLFEFVWLP